MPATEVVRAVRGIQHPLEVHTRRRADDSRSEQLVNLGVVRRVAVIERDAYIAPRPLDGGEYLLTPRRVDRHWLFAHHIAAFFEGPDDVGVVRTIDCCDDDLVWLGFVDHVVEIHGEVYRHGLVA